MSIQDLLDGKICQGLFIVNYINLDLGLWFRGFGVGGNQGFEKFFLPGLNFFSSGYEFFLIKKKLPLSILMLGI